MIVAVIIAGQFDSLSVQDSFFTQGILIEPPKKVASYNFNDVSNFYIHMTS